MRARQPDPEHLNLLVPYGPAIQKLALAARRLILEEAVEASEFVYELYTIANHFSFTGKPGDSFVYTTTHRQWLNLGFPCGALLPDPDGLLQGDGKIIRHVKIAQAADLEEAGVRELLRAAIAVAERPDDPVEPRTVVKRKSAATRRASPSRDRRR